MLLGQVYDVDSLFGVFSAGHLRSLVEKIIKFTTVDFVEADIHFETVVAVFDEVHNIVSSEGVHSAN